MIRLLHNLLHSTANTAARLTAGGGSRVHIT